MYKRQPYTFDNKNTRFAVNKLLEDGNPYLFVVSDQDFVKLSEVLELNGEQLTLRSSPMDWVFLS